jgi:hypothetical protein
VKPVKPAVIAISCGAAFLLVVLVIVIAGKSGSFGPPISVNSLDLFTAYATNEATADAKYTGRTVQFRLPYQSQFHKPFRSGGDYGLILRHPFDWDVGAAAPPPLVLVQLSASQSEKLAGAEGKDLIITGVCRGATERDIVYGRYIGVSGGRIELGPRTELESKPEPIPTGRGSRKKP